MLIALAIVGLTACRSVAKPAGWASPVHDSEFLVAADHDVIVAYSLADFEAQWRFPAPGAQIRPPAALYGTPAIDDDYVYVPTFDRKDQGSVHKLNLADGEIQWSFEHNTPILGSVTVSEAGVVFGDNDGRVFSLDPATGERSWTFDTDDRVWSTPAIAGDLVLVTSLDGQLYALDAATGDERWSTSTSAGIAASPVVDESAGVVYIAGLDSHVRAIDLASGERLWSFKGGNAFWATPVLANGVLYSADTNGNVYALNPDDGSELWGKPFTAEDPIRSAVLPVDDSVFVIDRDGHAYQLNAASGSSSGELALGKKVLADPVLLEGNVLVIITTGGDLIQVSTDDLAEIERKAIS